MKAKLKDPKGGLTPAGRKYYREKEGSRLHPGVKGPADTPTKQKRKGGFLTRFYGRKEVPPLTKNGKPTRYALAARAWGESAPSTLESVRKLYRKGLALLERYRRAKGKE